MEENSDKNIFDYTLDEYLKLPTEEATKLAEKISMSLMNGVRNIPRKLREIIIKLPSLTILIFALLNIRLLLKSSQLYLFLVSLSWL